MKRFLLFGGDKYYACGGWADFLGSFDSVEEALAQPKQEWRHVIDTHQLGKPVHVDGKAYGQDDWLEAEGLR